MFATIGLTLVLSVANVMDGPADVGKPAPAKQALVKPGLDDPRPSEYPGLHNVVLYAVDLYSGAVPEGDEGFDSLVALGVRSIISVDGAEPDVARAKARGLRYVHLPIGYNGFDEARRLELARAVQDLERPIYMHCHHGKHRSAGALGSAAVSLGYISNAQAAARMKVSGTAEAYKGLWTCVGKATQVTAEELAKVSPNFPEVSKPTDLVQAMVDVDFANDHLHLIEKAGWKAPANHPDLVPAAEAGRLADLLRHSATPLLVGARPEDYRVKMIAAQQMASALEEAIVRGDDPKTLSELFKPLAASCKACHVDYRD